MSCPTAESWFVPDRVYDLNMEDYVFCNQDVLQVKIWISDMMEHLNCEECNDPKLETYFDYLRYGPRWSCDKYGGGELIYTDADEKDTSHRQHTIQLRAKENPLEQAEKEPSILLKELVELLKEKDNVSGPSYPPQALEDIFRDEIADIYRTGYLRYDYINFIISHKTTEAKKDLLAFMSGQAGSAYIRPTMVFIGAMWDILSTPGQPTPGLAIAYDFLQDVIIVKEITYESGKHPLATPWPTKDGEPGFYLCKAPKTILQAMRDADVRKGSDSTTTFWLHLVILHLVGKWVLRHGEAMGMSSEDSEDLARQLGVIEIDLEKTSLPSRQEPKPTKKLAVVRSLEAFLYNLQFSESWLRDLAVMAKNAGMVATAETIARNFDRTLQDMKGIIEHPEKPTGV